MNDTVHSGWNPDLDIPSALRIVPADLRPAYALVTVVDSTPDVRALPSLIPLLQEMDVTYDEVDDDVAIPVSVLLRLSHDYDFFNGFDEVWLRNDIPAVGKPTELRLTSDVHIGSEPPPELVEWMEAAGYIAGLGDGDGLNYVTSDEWLESRWRGVSFPRFRGQVRGW